ncbi:sodium/solute symporter [Niveispirillum sp. SYP-B3756]|uniref:sodium:solute symporter n=1 Tax=Niveispirillum sp. SYP-B3756 TaxID=2662178 RepID=UPI001290C180|nr:sodium:solute symporter [Niveispirillum sp. SYP-B3756]MQP66749.1 sodium/solute symporter [Niveispirillum sp. SYP-B3756]
MLQGHVTLAGLDAAIIGLYLVAVVALGLFASRKATTATDYFLAARSSTWPTIGLALLASNISSTTLIGLAGAAYAAGIAVYNYEWMASVVLVFFCLFLLPVILRSQVYTMPEFLERRYDGSIRLYFSGLTIFLNIVVDTAGTLFGGALMFKLILPDVPLWQIAGLLALAAGAYTVAGGLKAVLVTEVVQAVILGGASIFVAIFAFDKAGGWDAVMAAVPADKMSLIRPADDSNLPWTGLISGVPLIGLYFWCTNQFMVQRVLSAKNLDHGRWGSLFAGLLKLPVLFLMVLPGSAAILIYPHLERPDLVYPTLIFDLLPVGVIGLVVAGFLAAIMSSIASTFNSASTLVTMDFVRRFNPDVSQASLVRIGRITTITFMVLAVAWVPVVENLTDTLWQYLQAVLAYAVPPVVALFLAGIFWRRANVAGARAGVIVGLLAGGWLFHGVQIAHSIQLHFLLAATLLFFISLAAVIVASLLTAPPPVEKTETLMWTRADYDAESTALAGRPLWQNYRVQAVALLAMTAVIVWLFR